MLTPRNIVLTGFMGTGKSTVGRLLAERLGWKPVDTDAMIVAREGRSIADIFTHDGETAFRALEAAVARELAPFEGQVIATGGRLMLDPVNAALLEARGRVFCLTAAPEVILARVRADGARRPLLDVADPLRRVRQLLAKRRAAYGRFEQIATDDLAPEQIAAELAQRLESPPPVQ